MKISNVRGVSSGVERDLYEDEQCQRCELGCGEGVV